MFYLTTLKIVKVQWCRWLIIIIFNLSTAAFKAYCAIWVRCSNFRHQASPRVSPRESTQRRKVELWARNVRKFCLKSDFHVTFRDFYMPQTYDMRLTALLSLRGKACWRFLHPKNSKASARCEPANLGTKGQYATSRKNKKIWVWRVGRLKVMGLNRTI
jgi:hypothetical protein